MSFINARECRKTFHDCDENVDDSFSGERLSEFS